MIKRNAAILGAVVLALGGCMDLNTENLNVPDANRALSEPGDVEALIGSAFLNWFDATQGYTPAMALSTAADEATASWGNFGMQDISSEPRTPFPNTTGYGYSSVVTSPWYDMYGVISAVNDGLNAIDDGMEFGDNGEDTPRAEAFAKFMQGLAHGFLALFFDKAFIFTEDDDLESTEFELVPYDEVMDAAIDMLDEAAQLAASSEFEIPSNWIGNQSYTSAQLAQIIKSYTARFLSAVARTPAERAAVDWQDVLSRINAGVTYDFGPILDNTDWDEGYKDRLPRYDWTRADYRAIGPADQSGNYQDWIATAVADRMPFDITSPDRRVSGADPKSDGTDFTYREAQNHRADRGTYHFSRYYHTRYMEIRKTGTGFDPILSLPEMDMLKAEAFIRLGQPEQAVPLINKTRTTRGQLPPATVTGVAGADCVPRTESGECGDLFDTLIYEKRIETFGVAGGLAFFDARGWGYLVVGTPLHLPIPARELETLGLPAYTFGGVGNPGSAQ